jgi:hypothetical protein
VDVPYIRLAKGLPSEAAQRKALADAGVSAESLADAYVDRAKLKAGEQSAWSYMMGAVRDEGEPDRVCVARPAILAPTEQEARARLAELAGQGGILFVASTGRAYRWHPDAADGIQFAADVRADERALVLARARAGLRQLGRQKFTAQQWKEAKELWADPAVTVADTEKRTGIGYRSLYRRFGPKGSPAFGRVKGKRK